VSEWVSEWAMRVSEWVTSRIIIWELQSKGGYERSGSQWSHSTTQRHNKRENVLSQGHAIPMTDTNAIIEKRWLFLIRSIILTTGWFMGKCLWLTVLLLGLLATYHSPVFVLFWCPAAVAALSHLLFPISGISGEVHNNALRTILSLLVMLYYEVNVIICWLNMTICSKYIAETGIGPRCKFNSRLVTFLPCLVGAVTLSLCHSVTQSLTQSLTICSNLVLAR
jgi:hypothetical protein